MAPTAISPAATDDAAAVDPVLLDFALNDADLGLYRAEAGADPRFTWLSPATARATGLDPATLLDPGAWCCWLHPEDVGGYREALADLDGGQVVTREYRICPPGGLRWIRDRVRVISAPGERPLRLVGSLQDVTTTRAGAVLEDALASVPDTPGVVAPDGRVSHCNEASADLERTEQTLRESEARYRALVHHAPMAICEFDREGRLRSMNAKALELGRMAEESEALGLEVTELVPHRDRALTRDLFDAALSGKAVDFEHVTTGRGGEAVHLASSIVPILDESGTVALVVSISNDVSAIRARELDLLHARETLEDALESLSEGVALFDEQGSLVLCNERYREFNAGCRDAPVPVPPGRGFARDTGSLPDAPAGGSAGTEESVEYLQCDGRWLMHSARRTRQGGVVVGLTDITERKQAEEALRESEGLVRQVLEACPVPVRMSRLDGGEILYQNAASVAITGERGPEESRWVHTYFADPADRIPYVQALTRDRRVDDYPLRLTRADGGTFPGSVSARLIEYKGEDVIVSTFKDLSDQIALEAQMTRQREALHQSEKLSALGELLASVAHELNNPLSIVVGQALLLEETASDPAIASRAARIGNAADRCSRIVRTFLAMARQKPNEPCAVNLNEVIEVALEITAYGLRTAEVDVRADLDPGLPAVLGDRDQLTQVITNLVLNALHALQSVDGARQLRVVSARRANLVQVRVIDNGPGVPEGIRGRIFEPLFTTKEVGAGTGIGLALCHRIIESHGGRFFLERTERAGATFTMRLPVDTGAGEEAPAETHGGVATGRLGVLVVDDEPEVAQMLADVLRGDGHEVETVHSGQQALARLGERVFDIVLSDLRMPGLDGRALHAALEAGSPQHLERIAFITGDTMDGPMRAFLEGSGRPYLEKPIRPDEVRNLVAAIRARGAKGGRG